MATLNSGLEYCEQNLKFPSISKYLSFRMSLLSAGTSRTVALPGLASNPAQVTQINPMLPFNTPQQGRRFIPYMLSVRDVSSASPGVAGNLSGSGATGGGTVQIVDQSIGGSPAVATFTAPATATPAPIYHQTFTVISNTISPYDQLAVVYTQPVGATATATGFCVDFFGFWQGGI